MGQRWGMHEIPSQGTVAFDRAHRNLERCAAKHTPLFEDPVKVPVFATGKFAVNP
jgi:hypothetical protein